SVQGLILRAAVKRAHEFRKVYVTETDANLLAKTRLNAPIKVGSGPSVEAMIRVEGRPRQIVVSTLLRMSVSITGQARTIGPPTITACGARPRMRFAMPMPRYLAVSFNAVRAAPSLRNARSIK